MSLPTSQSKLDVMQRKIARMKEDLAKEFECVMHESFAEFFKDHPTVKSISWAQYTPYFNDGDACYFSYYSMSHYPCTIKVNGEELRCDRPGSVHSWWSTDSGKQALRQISKLDNLISQFEDELEACFGDHCRVIATPAGFEVIEYEHD